MAITKILNIKESEGRNPASHLKNALEYIQNPDKTEECVLVGGINCLPDTAFEQMEETKNIFHKTGKRQGYHVIISFSPEEKVTAEQAMYVLEHFAKDVLGDDYEVVYAVHTDREHMHGHLIWNSVSMTTGKKYNSPKSNWKNHLQPITNKYCDELGLSIMPAEYSKNPQNISRDKWEKEMSMKEIILRDAKMCAYAAGNVEHFKYLMKRLGYVFKKDAWMEVQAPGFRYYHKLAKMDEMFSEDMLRHYVDMPWMSKPYFYSSDIRGLHRAKLSPYQKRFYSKLYRLRIVEQKRFIVGGAKYTEDLKRFHRLQDEYLLLVNNDIKSVVDLVDFISEQEEKIQQIEDRQHEIYRESSSRKRNIKTEAQYRKYQIWHVEVQEKLDELKQEKRKIKRQLQLADDIIKEDLYTAYYAVSGKEEIVADRDVEIPGMEEDMLVERTAGAVVESERNVVVMNQPANSHNDGNGQEEQINVAGKQQIDLEGTEMSKVHNLSDENVTRMDEGITDVTGKSELVEHEEKEPVDKAGWIVRRISELGGYENVSDSVKADIFGFDIADVSGSIRLFLDVMKKLGIKLDGDGLYEEFQRIYDEAVNRDVDKGKAEDKIWNKGRGR
ncbi:relaxase/mobilization nuclease domain-containing protein [Roseburia intestinalis]|uniref:Relaxase/mobilization nuclease domain-containing protein n=1 Tax=Roseburia intestinalis TaxID=166486 RepID=A0A6L6LBB2_9FIRM|nr:relaxase/mobilization nuclease domain-containing protein [Roseburia intestinalis]MTR87257.1 relaxase/mobilization nuclease domain-containing protein [Roseburia intestinalis]RHL98658.1 relaxase/mobilization nuclease [Roseburia intestinalis]